MELEIDTRTDFAIGELVNVLMGRYHPPGICLGSVVTRDGRIKVIIEHDYGIIQVYDPSQIERRYTPITTDN